MENAMIDKLYPLGLALGGGGARGFAHLGVAQALFEAGLHPDIISGTSAGSIVGAMLAAGRTPIECMEFFGSMKMTHLAKPAMSRKGFLEYTHLEDELEKFIGVRTFEELHIPLVVTASDMNTARPVHFRSGELLPRIIASCSIPVVFVPREVDGKEYVDGGVFMNLPVPAIRDLCRTVIGVNVSPMRPEEYKRNILSVTLRAFHFMAQANTVNDRSKCDMLIEPHNLYEYGNTELDKAEDIFMQGYAAANAILDTTEPTKTSICPSR